VAKSPAPRDIPNSWDITATTTDQRIPPRGTQDVVLRRINKSAARTLKPCTKRQWDQTIASRSAYAHDADDNKPSRCGSPPPTP